MQLQVAPHTPVDPLIAPVGAWRVDSARTEVRFAVRHVLVATVEARFAVLDGLLEVGPDGMARGEARIDAATIDTGNPTRDARLRSAEFFDVARYPVIAFAADAVEHVEGRRFRILGQLAIRDARHEIELDATIGRPARAARGHESIRLELRGRLSQRAFGVGRQTLAANRVVVRDAIKVAADVTVVKEVQP